MAAKKGKRRRKQPDPSQGQGVDSGQVLSTKPDPKAELARLKAAMEAEQKAIEVFVEDPKNENLKDLREALIEFGEKQIREQYAQAPDLIRGGAEMSYDTAANGIVLKIKNTEELKDKVVIQAFFIINPDMDSSEYGEFTTNLAAAKKKAAENAIDPEKLFSFTVEIDTAPQPGDELKEYLATLPNEARVAAEKLLNEVALDDDEIKELSRILKIDLVKGKKPNELTGQISSGSRKGKRIFVRQTSADEGEHDIALTEEKKTIMSAEIASDHDKELSQRILNAEYPLAEIAVIRAELVEILEKRPKERGVPARELRSLVKAYRRIGKLLKLPSELALEEDISTTPTRLYEEPPSPEEIAKKETITKAEAVLEIFCRHNWSLGPDDLQKNHLTFGDDGHLVTQSITRKNDQSTVKYRIVQEDASGKLVPHPDFPDELTTTVEPEVKLDVNEVRDLKKDVERIQQEINAIAQEKVITGHHAEIAAGRTLDIGDVAPLELGPKDGLSVQIDQRGENKGVITLGYQFVLHNHDEAQGLHAELNELQEKAQKAWVDINVFANIQRGEVIIQPQEVYDMAAELEGETSLSHENIEDRLKTYALAFEPANNKKIRDYYVQNGRLDRGQLSQSTIKWPADHFGDISKSGKPLKGKKYKVIIFQGDKDQVLVRVSSPADTRIREAILGAPDLKEAMIRIASLSYQLKQEATASRDRLAVYTQDDIKSFNEVIDLLELNEKYKLPIEVTTLKDGKSAEDEAREARTEFDEKEIVQVPVSYNREGKLLAKDKAGRNVYIDNIILPNGDYFKPSPDNWTPVSDQYTVKIQVVNKDRDKIKSYGADLYLSEASTALNDFRGGDSKLSGEQQARRQELDILLAADYEEDSEAEKKMEVDRLLETYEAVIANIVNTLETITPRELEALGPDDIIEMHIGERYTGVIGRIAKEKKEKDGTFFTLELQITKTIDKELEKYLGTADKLRFGLHDIGAADVLHDLEFDFKIKNGKVVDYEYTDLEELLVEEKLIPEISRAQSYINKYDQADSYSDRHIVLYELKEKLQELADQIDELRNNYIDSGTGDVQEIAKKLHTLLAEYNELKSVEQELRGRNVEQARLITLELATPEQRKQLLESRSPEEYERRFADIVRKTWRRWAYEAKQYDGDEVDLKSSRDLDSRGLEILIFTGIHPKDLKMEAVASGESKPGFFMFDTGYADGVDYRGDVDAAPKGAKINYPQLAKSLGISVREVKALYPDPTKKNAPDRTAICDHHADTSSSDSSSTEILYDVLRNLKVIDGATIKNALKRKEYLGRAAAEKLTEEEAERIFDKAVKFVSYADSFSHPKMADADWYKESYKTLLGLYKASGLDFYDVLYYFYNNRENQSADGTEVIPMSDLSNYPVRDRSSYSAQKRRLKDRSFNPKKQTGRDNQIDAYHIVKNSVEQSQEQMEELERKGLVVDTDPNGPARGMKLVIDLGGQNLRGAASAAYGLRQAAFLSWRPLDKKKNKHREGFFMSAPRGELGDSSVLTSRSEVVRGQMAVLGEQKKPLQPEFLQSILENLGVPADQIARVIEQVPEIKEPEKTKAEVAINQARKRVMERVLPDLQQAHQIIIRFDPTRGPRYDQMLERFIDQIRDKNPDLDDDTIEDLREEIDKL